MQSSADLTLSLSADQINGDTSTPLLPGEIWIPVPGWEGYYDISNLGRVRRMRRGPGTRPGLILRGRPVTRGYLRVQLSRNAQITSMHIHRLVIGSFLGPCPDGKVVNHINRIKTDNRLSNLEYVTPRENTHHYMLGKPYRGSDNANAKLNEADVRLIKVMLAHGLSHSRIAAAFNVSRSLIGLIDNGKLWGHIAAPRLVDEESF